MTRTRRYIFMALGGAVAALLLSLLAGAALLSTEMGNAWLAATLARTLSTPDQTVKIAGLTVSPPFDLRIAVIDVADREGTWLEIENARLDIAGAALLHGELAVRELSADTVTVSRLPLTGAAPTSAAPLRIDMPRLPVELALDKLAVRQILLAAAILGEPASLSLAGDARLVEGSATLNLALERIDQTPGNVAIALVLAGTPAKLDLVANIDEPTGLAMARLLDRTDRVPLEIALQGSGPVSDWRGKLTARAGTLLDLKADLHLVSKNGYHLDFAGEAGQAGLLPATLQPLIGERIRFAAVAGLDGNLVTFSRLSLSGTAAELEAVGKLDMASQWVGAEAHLRLPDLAAVETLAGLPLAGRLRIDAAIEGKLAQPMVEVRFVGEGARIAGFGIDRMGGQFRVAGEGDGADRWSVSGRGQFGGLSRDGLALPAGLDDRIDWSIVGTLDPASETFALDGLTVSGVGVDLVAAGQLSPQASQGSLTLQIAELGAFGSLAGLSNFRGQLSLDADLETDATAIVSAVLHGATENLHTGIAEIDALLGPRLEFRARAERNPGGQIDLSDLTLTGVVATMAGGGTYVPASDRLAGDMLVKIATLEPLGPSLETALRGSLSLTGKFGGTLRQPVLQARIDGQDLGTTEVLIRRLTVQADLSDFSRPAGTLTASFDLAGVASRLETGFAQPTPDRLSLHNLVFSAGGARLAGTIDYDIANGRAAGTLAGTVPDLEPWSALATLSLTGSADLTLKLGMADGQTADLRLTGNDLAFGAGSQITRIASLTLGAQGRDLTGTPNGHITADIAGAQTGGLWLARTRVQVVLHSADAADFAGDTTGIAAVVGTQPALPLRLELAGDWSRSQGGQRIALSRFVGTLGTDGASLRHTTSLIVDPDGYRLANLDLEFAGGRLSGDAALQGDSLAVRLEGVQLPLAPIGRILGRDLAGTIDLAADLDGPAAALRGHITLTGRSLRLSSVGEPDLPPLGLELAIRPDGNRLMLQGTVSDPDAKLIGVVGTIPFELRPRSLALIFPEKRPIALHFDGDGRLETIGELLPLGEDRLAGAYKVALVIDGTLAEPAAGGHLTIENGTYVNQAFGTEVKAITAELVGDRTRLTLTQASADDGQGGRITASGAIDLAASPSPALALQVKLVGFRIANSDDARVTADGEVRVEGSLDAPKLLGRLRVPRAEFRIPDRLPPSVVVLDVVRIDSRKPDVVAQKLAAAEQQAAATKTVLPVVLDLRIDIPGRTFVRGHGLESEWRGAITIAGNGAVPEIMGRLEAVHGTLELLGRSFVVRRGAIDFPSGKIDEPRFDILAEHSQADITARAALSGSPTSPRLVLSSDPQLPQDEILSRVLFGRDVSQITPAEGLQLAYAATNLARGGPGLLDRLRGAIGLDRLAIGTAPLAGTSEGAPTEPGKAVGGQAAPIPTVSGGKYVAPGVFIGAEQGATAQSTRTRVEIDVTRHITGYSSVGINGSSRVGVDWRYDY